MADKRDTTTGLGGRKSFFKNKDVGTPSDKPTAEASAPPPAPPAPPSPVPAQPVPKPTASGEHAERASFMTKSGRVRTTVTLWPETLATLEQIKSQNRRSGRKETLGDVLEAAVQALVRERNIKL